jgi:putative SOS response-associated peptidase YedK
MPVILSDDDADTWMLPNEDVKELQRLLVPSPEKLLTATPVSPRANSVKNDDPSVLEEVPGTLL